MLQLGNFSAWVAVDDAELPHYGVQYSDDRKQATCWIPSQVNKRFAVCWKDAVGLLDTCGSLTVDGTRCGAKHIHSATSRHPAARPWRNEHRKDSLYTSSTTFRPLTFAKLELTDDDVYLHAPTSTELGDIKLEIYQAHIGDYVKSASYRPPTLPGNDTEKVHERSKKAIGHRVQLGKEIVCREQNFINVVKVRLLYTFIFKYRPLEMLQANGIAPIEKKRKLPAMSSNDILDLTVDDNGSSSGRNMALKREKPATEGRKAKKVKTEMKTEASLTPLGLRRLGDVIDLT